MYTDKGKKKRRKKKNKKNKKMSVKMIQINFSPNIQI